MKRLTVIIVLLVAGLILLAEFTMGSSKEKIETEKNNDFSTKNVFTSNSITSKEVQKRYLIMR